jgi:hypothetical protein
MNPTNAGLVSGRAKAGEVISPNARAVATATSSKSARGGSRASVENVENAASSFSCWLTAAAAFALASVARASAVCTSERSAYEPPVSFPMASSTSRAARAASLASAPAFSFSFSALNCASVPKSTVG